MMLVIDWLPLVALVPLHAPLAKQEVALAELQVRVEELPEVMEEGEAERVRVGVGAGAATEKLTVVSGDVLPAVSLHFTYLVYVVPLVRPVSEVECEVAPVVVNGVMEVNVVPAAVAYAQVAASLVVTERVVEVVPAGSVPVGDEGVMVGGVVVAPLAGAVREAAGAGGVEVALPSLITIG